MLSNQKKLNINSIQRCKPLLGTYVEISICANETDDFLTDMTIEAFKKIEEIQNLMSFFDKNSELSYLNQNAHKTTCLISPEMTEILSQALRISKLSNGYYDISIAPYLIEQGLLISNDNNSDSKANYQNIFLNNNEISFNKKLQIDLGGIAKGYAVDKALEIFEDINADILINAGGDLAMNNLYGKLIDVKYSTTKNTLKLPMTNNALATSGRYYLDQNKSTIICPFTKKPLMDNRTICVFAKSCMLADALTKAVFLMPNSENLIKQFDAQAFTINKNGIVKSLSGERVYGT